MENTDDLLTQKIKETTKLNKVLGFEDLYEKDYQLARSLDLLIGMSVFKK